MSFSFQGLNVLHLISKVETITWHLRVRTCATQGPPSHKANVKQWLLNWPMMRDRLLVGGYKSGLVEIVWITLGGRSQ